MTTCEFKKECVRYIPAICDEEEPERCWIRKFAILMGTRKWNEAINEVLSMPLQDDCIVCSAYIQALKMEED